MAPAYVSSINLYTGNMLQVAMTPPSLNSKSGIFQAICSVCMCLKAYTILYLDKIKTRFSVFSNLKTVCIYTVSIHVI